MPTRSKVLGNGTIRGEETLRVPGGLKPLHAPLALAGRLMGILRTVIEITVLAMFHPREDFPLRRPVAFELVGEDHAGHVGEPLEEFTEELLGSPLVAPTLHEDIEDIAVLIHGSPEIMTFAMNCQNHLIQVPFVTRPRAPVTELIQRENDGVCSGPGWLKGSCLFTSTSAQIVDHLACITGVIMPYRSRAE